MVDFSSISECSSHNHFSHNNIYVDEIDHTEPTLPGIPMFNCDPDACIVCSAAP